MRSWLVALVLASLVAPGAIAAQTLADEDRVERILALRLEAERLLRLLDPDERERVEARIREELEKLIEALEVADAGSSDTASSEPDRTPGAEGDTAAAAPAHSVEGADESWREDRSPPSDDLAVASTEPAPEHEVSESEAPEEASAPVPAETRLEAPARSEPVVADRIEPPAPSPAPDSQSNDLAACGLGFLDTDGNGEISGFDRYWRRLELWTDSNGNDAVDEGETTSPFDHDIRAIDVSLETFRRKDDAVYDVRRGRYVTLRFRPKSKDDPVEMRLAVQADGLRRREGPSLLDAEGRELTGVQPLLENQQVQLEDGEARPVLCETPSR